LELFAIALLVISGEKMSAVPAADVVFIKSRLLYFFVLSVAI
jgi:hypothetical protein